MDAAKTVVQAFIACRLDWCNSLLYGVAESPVGAKRRRSSTYQHTAPWPHHSSVASTSLAAGPETSGIQDCVCVVHQSLTSTAPAYLSADIRLISEHGRRHLRSSSYRTLVVTRTRTSFGDRSFAAAGPRLWNTLPSTLRQMTSYGQFRRNLKAHLFRV